MILGSPGKVGRCQIYTHLIRKDEVGFLFADLNFGSRLGPLWA